MHSETGLQDKTVYKVHNKMQGNATVLLLRFELESSLKDNGFTHDISVI